MPKSITSPHIDARIAQALFRFMHNDMAEMGTTLSDEIAPALDDAIDAAVAGDKQKFHDAARRMKRLLKTVKQEQSYLDKVLRLLEAGNYEAAMNEYGLGKGKE